MSYRLAAFLVLIIVGILWCRGPSASRIVARTEIAREAGALVYEGLRYEAEWGEPVVHQGNLRRLGRARYEYAPFFTHDAVVTTGEFSDPKLVSVSKLRQGSMYWSAPREPQGSLIVLHFIPADATVLKALQSLDVGDCARFTGREETDSEIRGSDGGFVRLTHDNHKYLLVERIQACP